MQRWRRWIKKKFWSHQRWRQTSIGYENNKGRYIPTCKASFIKEGAITAAHCLSLLRAIQIVGDGTPKLKYSDHQYVPLTETRVGDELHDVALIILPFTPENYYELAEDSEDEYHTNEIRSPGESGKPMLNEEGKICAVLSRSKDGETIYSGIQPLSFKVWNFSL